MRALVGGCALLAILPVPVLAQSDTVPGLSQHRPFLPGERLTYALSWMGIRAGTAVLEVADAPPVNGHPVLRLLTTALSAPMITKIYPVDNRVETVADADTLLPHRMLFRRREGKRHNDFDVTFSHDKGSVLSIKDGVKDQLPIPARTFDSVSCLYFVRTLPVLVPGSSVHFNIHHDKKTYKVEVQVEAIEPVHGPWGTVEAVRVLAIMPFQGIFLNEGNIRVWVTNDARRVPLMMKAKVVIGSVVAKLIEGAPVPPVR